MAEWFDIHFDAQGGTAQYATLYYLLNSAGKDGYHVSRDKDSTKVTANPATKPGYLLDHWNGVADGTGTSFSSGAVFREYTIKLGGNLYAIWGPAKATISKTNLAGGTAAIYYDTPSGKFYSDADRINELPRVTIQEGGASVDAWGPIELPVKECYVFAGAYSGTNNTGTLYIDENGYIRQALADLLANATTTQTIRATGVEVSKKLTLNDNGGTGGCGAIYNSLADRSKWYGDYLCEREESDPISAVPVPGKITSANVGYVFAGYKYSSTLYIDPDGSLSNNLTSLTNFTSRSATANWLTTKKITVDPNGGTGGDAFFWWCSSLSAYFHAVDGKLTQTSAIVKPSYAGHEFAGLYTAATGGEQKVAADGTIASGLTSATTLYAQWTRVSWRVDFSGALAELPPFYIKISGGGLYRDADCAEPVASGESLWDSPPGKDGHIFLGVFAADSSSSTRYASAAGAATADSSALAAEGDITVYCVFAVLQPVVFDDSSGSGGPGTLWYLDHNLYVDSRGETAAAWPLAAIPARESFAFLGYFDEAGSTQYVSESGAMTQSFFDLVAAGISEELDLYAQWNRLTWRVTIDGAGAVYSLAGGEIGWTSDPEGTEPISSLPVPERTGYQFLGYFTASNEQVVDSDGDIINFVGGSGEVAIYAHWAAKAYTLSFSDGSPAVTVTYDEPIGSLPPDPQAPEGQEFRGWRVFGVYVSAETVWRWTENALAEAIFSRPVTPGFGGIEDWFNLASPTLVPIESDAGDNRHQVIMRHYGSVGASATSFAAWRNPTVKYMVVGDMTLVVVLGLAFSSRGGATGYMITSVTIETGNGRFPVVTVQGTANEGVSAINRFTVSVDISARARVQNLLGALAEEGGVTTGGELQTCSLQATSDPVVLAENMMPCASDLAGGHYELHAETLAMNGEAAPTTANYFDLLAASVVGEGTNYRRYRVTARKEM